MTKWEYHSELVPAGNPIPRLNELGAEGWESIGYDSDGNYLFKRPLAPYEPGDRASPYDLSQGGGLAGLAKAARRGG